MTEPGDLYKLLADETRSVESVVEMTKEAMLVTTSPADTEFEEESGNTNVVLAAFTTAQAQLKLYSYMEPLGNRCLYTDTGQSLLVPSIDL